MTVGFKKIVIELNISEAKSLQRIIQNHNPSREDELTASMLYARVTRKIEEVMGKNES